MPSFSKTISGLTPALKVILYWRPESSDTADSSTGNVNMNGTYTVSFSYEYDVTYVWSLYYYEGGLATTKIDGGTVYTETPAPTPSYSISYTHNSVTASISNLNSGDNVVFTVYNGAGGSVAGSSSDTASDSSMSLSVGDLASGTYYYTTVTVNETSIGTKYFNTKNAAEFEWTTNIRAGEKMNTYNYAGTQYPAPVTAKEWNELVDLVNTKCGTDINHVVSGAQMSAQPGGNVRCVANALGVSVNSGDRITAEFFFKLRDAINQK